jgi:hypothetical protein
VTACCWASMSVTQLAVMCAEPGADGVEHLHGYISISLLSSGPLCPYLLYLLWLHPSNQGYPSLPPPICHACRPQRRRARPGRWASSPPLPFLDGSSGSNPMCDDLSSDDHALTLQLPRKMQCMGLWGGKRSGAS